MLWCALALLVSQPPQPCLGYAQRMKPLRTPPPTQPPLKGGKARWRRPLLPAILYTAATRCCAMLCYDMLGYAMRSRAVLCYAML